jgi:hypothetical protein
MKKYIPILLATSLLLSACSIDWNDAKDKKIAGLEQEIVELKTKNNVEQEKLEFEKQKYEDSQIKESEEKCNEAYEKNSKKFEDFVNTCT